jgi:hypothetical protein
MILTVRFSLHQAEVVYEQVPVLRAFGKLAKLFILHDHFGSIENVIRTNRLAHKKYSNRMVVRMILKIVS